MKTLLQVFRGQDGDAKLLWLGMLLGAFAVAGVFGFVYETIFYYFDCGRILRRGAMFLPMVPIYSFGSLLIIAAAYDWKGSPLLVLLFSGLSSSLLEFVVGYLMFHLGNGYRAWDYNVEIWNWGNIGGYVCFRSAAFFAVSGMMLIYVVLPLLKKLAETVGVHGFLCVILIVTAVVALDFVYNYVIAALTGLPNARVFYAGIGWPSV